MTKALSAGPISATEPFSICQLIVLVFTAHNWTVKFLSLRSYQHCFRPLQAAVCRGSRQRSGEHGKKRAWDIFSDQNRAKREWILDLHHMVKIKHCANVALCVCFIGFRRYHCWVGSLMRCQQMVQQNHTLKDLSSSHTITQHSHLTFNVLSPQSHFISTNFYPLKWMLSWSTYQNSSTSGLTVWIWIGWLMYATSWKICVTTSAYERPFKIHPHSFDSVQQRW